MKLNLGSGTNYKKGFINVDFDNEVKADKYFDLRKRFPIKTNSAEYILAQDVLEHFTKEDAEKFLDECWRVLHLGGKLKVRVPNINKIAEQFSSDPPVMMKFIYGDTSKSGELGAHKFGYTKEMLIEALAKAGFVIKRVYFETTNIIGESKKVKKKKIDLNILISGLDSGGIGGAEVFLVDLGDALKRDKNKVSYLSVMNKDFNHFLKGRNTYDSSRRMDFVGGYKGLFKFFMYFHEHINWTYKTLLTFKRNGGNVVILPGFTDKIVISPIAAQLGIKVIWIEFGPISELLKRFFYLPQIIYRIVSKYTDLVIVPSENTKRNLIRESRISESRVRKIFCGIQLVKVPKKTSGKKFVIGVVSRLQKEKGQDELIKATKLLINKIPNIELRIIGDGDYKEELKEIVKKLNLKNDVKFKGFVKNKYKEISEFDVFVFPTRWKMEGFGLVALEAMMVGIPLVASNSGPVPEVVGNAGLVVEPNARELSNAILKIYKNKNLANDLIKKAKNRVKNFDINNIASQYEKEIKEIFISKI